jgi:cytochrome c
MRRFGLLFPRFQAKIEFTGGHMSKLVLHGFVFASLVSLAVAGPLHDAVKEGDIAKVKVLIAGGEDVNQKHRNLGTPLHQASILGSQELAELLIALGANVNADNKILGTPLYVAARKGNVGMVVTLIAHGADVSDRWTDGSTPLHAAAEGGHAQVVDLLIANGADVNARSADTAVKKEFPGYDGYPALHSAAFNDHHDIVDLLRAYGARGPIVEPVTHLLAFASASDGERIYNLSCNDCHNIDKGGLSSSKINLWGVLGQKKASIVGVSYSKAFTRLQGTWTLAEFNAYITSPVDYVPGTKMRFEGFKDAQTRANLIAFLRSKSDSPPPLPPTAK